MVEAHRARRVLLDEAQPHLGFAAHQPLGRGPRSRARRIVGTADERPGDLASRRVRLSGSIVVSRSCADIISPRPLSARPRPSCCRSRARLRSYGRRRGNRPSSCRTARDGAEAAETGSPSAISPRIAIERHHQPATRCAHRRRRRSDDRARSAIQAAQKRQVLQVVPLLCRQLRQRLGFCGKLSARLSSAGCST